MKKEKHGLLFRYFTVKKQAYIEPVSRGKYAKGLSLKKYLISIFTALTSWPLAKVAQKGKVSHALLRKWRVETEYKKNEEEHVREFVSIFIEAVNDARVTWLGDFQKGEELFQELLSEYGNSYGQRLRMAILKRMEGLSKEQPESYLPFTAKLSMQNLASGVRNIKKSKALAEHFNKIIRNKQLGGIQDSLEKIASKLEELGLSKKELKKMSDVLLFCKFQLFDFIEEEPGDKKILARIKRRIRAGQGPR
jgi:hypothetical protein